MVTTDMTCSSLMHISACVIYGDLPAGFKETTSASGHTSRVIVEIKTLQTLPIPHRHPFQR